MKTYTLKVTLPAAGKVSRTIEMAAAQTLHDLHYAIQDAFEWDADHLYSFFMSGKAWDSESEYTIPEGKLNDMLFESWDEDEDEDEDDEFDEEFDEEEEDEELELPQTPEERKQFYDALQNLSDDDAAQLSQMMREEIGVPEFVADMMLDFVKSLGQEEFEMLLDPEQMEAFMDDDEEGEDSTIATLDSLDLSAGDTFMYLFDYGDEWRFQVRVQKIDENAEDDAEYPQLVDAAGEAPPQYPDWDEEDDEDEAEDWDEEEVWGDEEDEG